MRALLLFWSAIWKARWIVIEGVRIFCCCHFVYIYTSIRHFSYSLETVRAVQLQDELQASLASKTEALGASDRRVAHLQDVLKTLRGDLDRVIDEYEDADMPSVSMLSVRLALVHSDLAEPREKTGLARLL